MDTGADVEMRSGEQNKIFHAWCGVIATHLQAGGVMVSKETVKELVLLQLGNVKMVDNVPGMPADIIAMRSHRYKISESDLTYQDQKSGFIAMDELLGRMEAWAATDLDGLILPRDEE